MRKDLHSFRFRGIHISIHWTFILILIWFVIVNVLTRFTSTGWIWSLIMILSLIISIFAHDLAQAVVGAIYGIKINSLIVMPIGGLPSISKKPAKKYYELLMLAAGPAANLSIAAFLFYFLHPFKAYWDEPGNMGAAYEGNFIFQFQFINLSLGLLNLLPSFPMDGGRALDTILEKKYSAAMAKRIVNFISICFALSFLVTGIIYMTFPIILTGFFIFFTLRKGKYYHPFKSDVLYAVKKL